MKYTYNITPFQRIRLVIIEMVTRLILWRATTAVAEAFFDKVFI